MRRVILFAAAVAIGCTSKHVTKEEDVVNMKERQPKPDALRKRVAVVDFEDKTEYGRGRLGRGAADILTTYLVECEQFLVVERMQISKCLDEMKLGSSGIVDANTAAQVGKAVGAAYVVYGAVTNFGLRAQSSSFVVGSNKKYVTECTVDVRVIEVESTIIRYAKSGRGTAERSSTKVLGAGTASSYDETLAGDSLRASIVKMMDKLIDACP